MHSLDIHAGATEVMPPEDFRWPGGKRIAVFLRVSFEWWSDGKWPGIGPMGNPLQQGHPDLNAVGWAEYGHRRGIFRILDVLSRQGVRATVNVSGIMAERHPEIVRRISDEGHEVVAHSYAMDVVPIYLSEEQERDKYQGCRSRTYPYRYGGSTRSTKPDSNSAAASKRKAAICGTAPDSPRDYRRWADGRARRRPETGTTDPLRL